MPQDKLLVGSSPKKTLAGLAAGLALLVAGTAHAVPFSYGFEDGFTGDWTPPIVNIASGGGVLGVSSAEGSRHAEIINIPGSSGFPCCGGGNSSSFDHTLLGASPAVGAFFQSIAVYIDTTLDSSTSGIPAFWIDMSPRNTATTFSEFGLEHSFRIATDGTDADVSVDAGGPIATLADSGWYVFEFAYRLGVGGTVETDAYVRALDNSILGSLTGMGSAVPNAALGSEGYVWLTNQLNGYSSDVLAIDCIQSGLGDTPGLCVAAAVPEPATLALLGVGMFAFGLRRRKQA